MVYKTEAELLANKGIVERNNNITIRDIQVLKDSVIDNIANTIVLTDSAKIKQLCYWITYCIAQELGVIPASILGLYEARGRNEIRGFTVPAINIRTLTYDSARAVFRSAKKINAGAMIFEIAKSEISYTNQQPLEYTSLITLAAIKENYECPLFLQGDHFQANVSNYTRNPEQEITQLRGIIEEAITNGFYNIDIDSSTLVDVSKETILAQQKLNYEICARLTKFIRQIQPQGIDISIGGEIGEVGGKNSTAEELTVFMDGYLKEIGTLKGISKMSIQTGTTHGGVILPDGSIARVNIDFETLKNLSQLGREKYGLAGCVQHGASTLPNEAFDHFTKVECAEIHLATQFQNLVYEYMPLPLKEKIYGWLNEHCSAERKSEQTNDQFIYKARKKALGPFKKEIASLSYDVRKRISKVLEEEFDFLFEKLQIKDTLYLVKKYVKSGRTKKFRDFFVREEKK